MICVVMASQMNLGMDEALTGVCGGTRAPKPNKLELELRHVFAKCLRLVNDWWWHAHATDQSTRQICHLVRQIMRKRKDTGYHSG